ncbi:EcsC family protein [Oculatella sp. LEGE 06141]|uniref:EcsC family protein n=1 Tax=Oculatella sp. LEGE 06141 TaxID=1828648 RepID=UPI001882AC08|nr:EcsC family protein [Oculatella sp. LEGE 06141]MBE9182811.1 EcsC family protein [Oculatella sp. LEGE 06141]
MTDRNQPGSQEHTLGDAIATAVKMASDVTRFVTDQLTETTATVSQTVGPLVYDVVEQSTETVGKIVTPIAENPLVKFATKLPVINWFMAAVGQVDEEKVQRDVVNLKSEHSLESAEQLANRVITDTAFQAARVGFLTNIAPPLALTLFAIDITAIAALQAEMIYRIAAIYGFPPHDPARRGEVLIIWGLSTGGSSVVKTGLSVVELLPFIGTAVGITSNAAILYSLGRFACLFYEEKQRLERSPDQRL